MDGQTVPDGGDLDAGDQHNVEIGGGAHRFGKTAGFVVIRQREQTDASRCRAADQFRRREHSIGLGGVGV